MTASVLIVLCWYAAPYDIENANGYNQHSPQTLYGPNKRCAYKSHTHTIISRSRLPLLYNIIVSHVHSDDLQRARDSVYAVRDSCAKILGCNGVLSTYCARLNVRWKTDGRITSWTAAPTHGKSYIIIIHFPRDARVRVPYFNRLIRIYF